jgi:hypothetical protein
MTTITQITHGHPAYDVVTEFLEHEVGRVHVVEDEIPTRTTYSPLTKEHRVLQAIHPR